MSMPVWIHRQMTTPAPAPAPAPVPPPAAEPVAAPAAEPAPATVEDTKETVVEDPAPAPAPAEGFVAIGENVMSISEFETKSAKQKAKTTPKKRAGKGKKSSK